MSNEFSVNASMDWERLRNGNLRALDPDNQPIFDELFRLRKEARDAQNVIIASTMNETLHLHLQMNYNGRYVIRDGVIALNQITQGVFGTKLVALRCQEYLEDMIEAIDKVNAEQKSNEPL